MLCQILTVYNEQNMEFYKTSYSKLCKLKTLRLHITIKYKNKTYISLMGKDRKNKSFRIIHGIFSFRPFKIIICKLIHCCFSLNISAVQPFLRAHNITCFYIWPVERLNILFVKVLNIKQYDIDAYFHGPTFNRRVCRKPLTSLIL